MFNITNKILSYESFLTHALCFGWLYNFRKATFYYTGNNLRDTVKSKVNKLTLKFV